MNRNLNGSGRGEMSVREAGRKGGKIGGETTARTHGHEFYSEIGHKGGQRVRELIRRAEGEEEGRGRQ